MRDGGALVLDSTPAAYDAVYPYPTGPEFRPRAEVTSPASLSTWAGLPLVRGHFTVDMSNVSQAIGYVRAAKDGGDGWIHAELVVVDDGAIADIEAGALVELSGGYVTDVRPSRGMHRGQTYEGVQTTIRMNHLAIGPRNWARGGNEARVR
ncbi:MAG: DUF2213 domain-containing protein [Labilithrix sp.]|nr:DUF2213 domain-containing protein [Labilithrix sp.]